MQYTCQNAPATANLISELKQAASRTGSRLLNTDVHSNPGRIEPDVRYRHTTYPKIMLRRTTKSASPRAHQTALKRTILVQDDRLKNEEALMALKNSTTLN